MEHVVEGLHSNQSLSKLSVLQCKFNLEATDVFRCFMQKCETGSSFRELCIGGDVYMFEGGSAGAMLASMLTTPDEKQATGSTYASSLQVLNLDSDFAGFWDAFAANASRIRLPCLRPRISSNADWEALNRCLPKLVYLKELDFRNEYYIHRWVNCNSRNFISALQTNGSLQHVIITQADFYNEAELCLIQSFCKQNEVIPILVSDSNTDLSLLPMLFHLAMQAPRTAPNAIFAGLLATQSDLIRV